MNGATTLRPALFRLSFVLLASTGMAQMAHAQTNQPQNTNTNMMIAPPSDADLTNPNAPALVPQLGSVPRLQPVLSPQAQANYLAGQQAQQQAGAQQQRNMGQPVSTPQLVPMNNNNPQTMTVPVTTAPGQQQNTVTSTAPVGTPVTAPIADTNTTGTTSTTTTTTETTAAPTTPNGTPTNTAGFTTKAPGTPDRLPLNSGTMPATTNPGMDMSINPNLVGGVGQVDAAGNPVSAVPYEVQLQQRTQELQVQARDQAYEQAKKSVLPMETYEIRDVLNRLKDTQEAIQTPARPAPTPNNTIETISTDPSATPKIIRLAAGNVTTINIVDITGEPWPIVDLGFGGAFDVKPPEAGGHVIRITPLKDFARGNLVIRLLKMTTPITFSLQSGGDTVNYRFDARIPDYGPNARMPLIDNGLKTVAGDKTTTAFLEGVPPKGADKLAVGGVDGRTSAYKYAGTLYVRTPLTLISPAWQGSATSGDGMNVYVLSDAPVLLLSDKGALVRARISDAKKEATGF